MSYTDTGVLVVARGFRPVPRAGRERQSLPFEERRGDEQGSWCETSRTYVHDARC